VWGWWGGGGGGGEWGGVGGGGGGVGEGACLRSSGVKKPSPFELLAMCVGGLLYMPLAGA